jgi:hypothetical protein
MDVRGGGVATFGGGVGRGVPENEDELRPVDLG